MAGQVGLQLGQVGPDPDQLVDPGMQGGYQVPSLGESEHRASMRHPAHRTDPHHTPVRRKRPTFVDHEVSGDSEIDYCR
ncbi:hypothetical protein GCM10029963_67140 [Micromonospora andamanensis]